MFERGKFVLQSSRLTGSPRDAGSICLSQNRFYFGFFYFAYAGASGRCLMPGRSSRK